MTGPNWQPVVHSRPPGPFIHRHEAEHSRSPHPEATPQRKAPPMTAVSTAQALNTAAQLLAAAGRADTHPGARVHALLAAEHLRIAGADPPPTSPVDTSAEQLIRAALTHLTALPGHTLTDADVLAASSAARTALARAEQP